MVIRFLIISFLLLFLVSCEHNYSSDASQDLDDIADYECAAILIDTLIPANNTNGNFSWSHFSLGKHKGAGSNSNLYATPILTYFIENSPKTECITAVQQGFKDWESSGMCLKFERVNKKEEADFRIKFDLSKSYSVATIGNPSKYAIDTPAITFHKAYTLEYGYHIVLHEIGHVLGLEHEHRNIHCPFVGNWDTTALLVQFSPMNRTDILNQIIRPIREDYSRSAFWDSNSVMNYSFDAACIKGRKTPFVAKGLISEEDKAFVQKRYQYLCEELPMKRDPKASNENSSARYFIANETAFYTFDTTDFAAFQLYKENKSGLIKLNPHHTNDSVFSTEKLNFKLESKTKYYIINKN